MTMPKTAACVSEFGCKPVDMTDEQLEAACEALEHDLPGALPYINQAARASASVGEYRYLSRSPSDVGGRAEWDTLVGYLARLFASPFRAIPIEQMRRRYGVSVAFVNCCIVAAWPGDIDEDELWCLQSRMQLTPDC